ncbi:MAG: hypothetical protein KIS81_04955 [Maricaulaceae bacterium]|nr:hypothetical protein [Maricaulaceae bacterium]
MRIFSSLLAAAAACALAACATTGETYVFDEAAGEAVPMTVYRGEDGRLRDADGNVWREARFVRHEGRISDSGDPDDIYCVRRRPIGSSLYQTVCATRAEFVMERELAREAARDAQRPLGEPPATAGGAPR